MHIEDQLNHQLQCVEREREELRRTQTVSDRFASLIVPVLARSGVLKQMDYEFRLTLDGVVHHFHLTATLTKVRRINLETGECDINSDRLPHESDLGWFLSCLPLIGCNEVTLRVVPWIERRNPNNT